MEDKSKGNIKLTDGAKIFITSLVFIFVGCVIIIVYSLIPYEPKPQPSSGSPAVHYEYKTLTVDYEGKCDFSEMLDDKWQLTGIQIKENETNFKFRKNTN